MLYSNEEAFDTLMIYGEYRQNATQAADLYAVRFPNRRVIS